MYRAPTAPGHLQHQHRTAPAKNLISALSTALTAPELLPTTLPKGFSTLEISKEGNIVINEEKIGSAELTAQFNLVYLYLNEHFQVSKHKCFLTPQQSIQECQVRKKNNEGYLVKSNKNICELTKVYKGEDLTILNFKSLKSKLKVLYQYNGTYHLFENKYSIDLHLKSSDFDEISHCFERLRHGVVDHFLILASKTPLTFQQSPSREQVHWDRGRFSPFY